LPLLHDSKCVSLLFADQKNRAKHSTHSQQRTGDLVLCSVLSSASIVERIRRLVPDSGQVSPINAVLLSGLVLPLSSNFLCNRLQVMCTIIRGQPTFGHTQADIGTKSLRSGAVKISRIRDWLDEGHGSCPDECFCGYFLESALRNRILAFGDCENTCLHPEKHALWTD
jgi:hypothetical protein